RPRTTGHGASTSRPAGSSTEPSATSPGRARSSSSSATGSTSPAPAGPDRRLDGNRPVEEAGERERERPDRVEAEGPDGREDERGLEEPGGGAEPGSPRREREQHDRRGERERERGDRRRDEEVRAPELDECGAAHHPPQRAERLVLAEALEIPAAEREA